MEPGLGGVPMHSTGHCTGRHVQCGAEPVLVFPFGDSLVFCRGRVGCSQALFLSLPWLS